MKTRPRSDALQVEWVEYSYAKTNTPGEHTEWWYHRLGCRQWFVAVRNTSTNEVLRTLVPDDRPR